MSDVWAAVTGVETQPLVSLFKTEPDRLSRLALDEAGIRFDFSKTHLNAGAGRGVPGAGRARATSPPRATPCSRAKSSTAAKAAPPSISPSAARARPTASRRAKGFHARMRGADRRDRGRRVRPGPPCPPYRHRRIGARPELLIDALGRDAGRYDSAVVSNVDGAALEEALARFDPNATLVVIASKTFTTSETMLNARVGA